MNPEDNPADDRTELDLCIEEIKRLQSTVHELCKVAQEMYWQFPEEAQSKIIAQCRESDLPCYCGVHVSETMETS